MGFYGNIVYNTYGLQDKSVQPRHLDRDYWRHGRKIGVKSFEQLRKEVLNLPKIGENGFSENDWDNCWAEAEKSIFAFHFTTSTVTDSNGDERTDESLRRAFGAGLILGWVIKEVVVSNENTVDRGNSYNNYQYALYMLASGNMDRTNVNRPGSLFKILLDPTGYTEDEKISKFYSNESNQLLDNFNREEDNGWSNNTFLIGPKISRLHLLNNSVTTEKINNSAVTTDKIHNSAVTTNKIDNLAVTTEKINNSAVTTDKIHNSAVTTDKINNSAVTTDKINNSAVKTDKIDNFAVTKDKIQDGEVVPEKLDRKYLIKNTVETEITSWTQLYQHVNNIYNNSLENPGTVTFLKGIVSSILPPLYKNYSIGHSIGWLNDNNVCMLVDIFNGNFWVIEKNQGQKEDVNVYTDPGNNINYRIFLRSKPKIENVDSGKTELKLTAEAEYNLGIRAMGVSLIDDDLNITTQANQKTIFKFVTTDTTSISFVNNTQYPIIYMPANGNGVSRTVSPGNSFKFSASTLVRLEFYFNNNYYFCESYAFTNPRSVIYNVKIELVFGNNTTPIGFSSKTPIWGASPNSSARIDITEKFKEFLTSENELIIPVALGQTLSETKTIKDIVQLVGSYQFPAYMGSSEKSMWIWQGGCLLQDDLYLNYGDRVYKEGTVVLQYVEVPLL